MVINEKEKNIVDAIGSGVVNAVNILDTVYSLVETLADALGAIGSIAAHEAYAARHIISLFDEGNDKLDSVLKMIRDYKGICLGDDLKMVKALEGALKGVEA